MEQDQDWMDRLVDRIADWMDSLTEKDDYPKLATPFQEGTEAEIETSSTPPSKGTTETL